MKQGEKIWKKKKKVQANRVAKAIVNSTLDKNRRK